MWSVWLWAQWGLCGFPAPFPQVLEISTLPTPAPSQEAVQAASCAVTGLTLFSQGSLTFIADVQCFEKHSFTYFIWISRWGMQSRKSFLQNKVHGSARCLSTLTIKEEVRSSWSLIVHCAPGQGLPGTGVMPIVFPVSSPTPSLFPTAPLAYGAPFYLGHLASSASG